MPLMLVVTGLHVRAVGSWSCGTGADEDQISGGTNKRNAGMRCHLRPS